MGNRGSVGAGAGAGARGRAMARATRRLELVALVASRDPRHRGRFRYTLAELLGDTRVMVGVRWRNYSGAPVFVPQGVVAEGAAPREYAVVAPGTETAFELASFGYVVEVREGEAERPRLRLPVVIGGVAQTVVVDPGVAGPQPPAATGVDAVAQVDPMADESGLAFVVSVLPAGASAVPEGVQLAPRSEETLVREVTLRNLSDEEVSAASFGARGAAERVRVPACFEVSALPVEATVSEDGTVRTVLQTPAGDVTVAWRGAVEGERDGTDGARHWLVQNFAGAGVVIEYYGEGGAGCAGARADAAAARAAEAAERAREEAAGEAGRDAGAETRGTLTLASPWSAKPVPVNVLAGPGFAYFVYEGARLAPLPAPAPGTARFNFNRAGLVLDLPADALAAPPAPGFDIAGAVVAL